MPLSNISLLHTIMENNTQAEKRKKWVEYEVLEYVESLREAQKEDPAPLVFRAKINDLAGHLYIDGYTCLQISRLLSMGKCTVYRVLRRKNIFKAQDRSIPKEVEENVVSMYRQGQKARAISELLNITIPSIRWILIKNKIPAHRLRVIAKRDKPTKEILEKAVQMYHKSVPYEEIKAELGINNSHLYDALHERGVSLRGGHAVKTKERIAAEEEAIRLYRDTDTGAKQISKETGIPYTTLKRLLKKRSIPLRDKPLELEETQKEEAVRLYRQGWTYKAISEKTGVNTWRLQHILKKGNIALRGRMQAAITKKLQEETPGGDVSTNNILGYG